MNRKQIINEAIISQSDFLMNIINIVKSNPKISGRLGVILTSVKKDFDKIESLQGKKNKKARNQLLIQIHNDLKMFNGIDGSPLDFKGIRPLYDSIYEFILNKSNVNLDDCLLASDLFMKNIYSSLSPENVEKINKGKFPLTDVFALTKYYKEYEERVEETLKYIEIFENEEFKIVYPQSYYGFVKYIKETMDSADDSLSKEITWCTQKADTYANYLGEHYLMIYTKKNVQSDDPKFIVSFKVTRPYDANGEVEYDDMIIDYEETCDRFNDHMSEEDFEEITPEIYRQIIDNITKYRPPEDMSDKEIEDQLYKLYRLNAHDKIYDFLSLAKKEESIFSVKEILDDEVFLIELISSFLPKIFAEEAYANIWINSKGDLKTHKKLKAMKFLDTLGSKIFGVKKYAATIIGDVVDKLKEKIRSPRSHYEEAYLLTYLEQIGFTTLSIEDANAIVNKVCNTNNETTMQKTFNSIGKWSFFYKPENHVYVQETLLNSKLFLNHIAKDRTISTSLSSRYNNYVKMLYTIALSNTENFAKIISQNIVAAQKRINQSSTFKVKENSSGEEFIKEFDNSIIIPHVYNKILGLKATEDEKSTLKYLLSSDVNDINMLHQNWTSSENVINLLFSKVLYSSKKVDLVNAFIDYIEEAANTSSLTEDNKVAIAAVLTKLCDASMNLNLSGGSPNLGFTTISFRKLFTATPSNVLEEKTIRNITTVLLNNAKFDLLTLFNRRLGNDNGTVRPGTLSEEILKTVPSVYWSALSNSDQDIYYHVMKSIDTVQQEGQLISQRRNLPEELVPFLEAIVVNGKDLILNELSLDSENYQTLLRCIKLIKILTSKGISSPDSLNDIIVASLKESSNVNHVLKDQDSMNILKNAFESKSNINQMLIDLSFSLKTTEQVGFDPKVLDLYCDLFKQVSDEHNLTLDQREATIILSKITSLRSFNYSRDKSKVFSLIDKLLPSLITIENGVSSARSAARILNAMFSDKKNNELKNACNRTLLNISRNASDEVKQLFKDTLQVDTDLINQAATAVFGGNIPTGVSNKRKIKLFPSNKNESILRNYIKSILS